MIILSQFAAGRGTIMFLSLAILVLVETYWCILFPVSIIRFNLFSDIYILELNIYQAKYFQHFVTNFYIR